MAEEYLTFKKFNDPELANGIAELLKENNIECAVEDNRGKFFDVSFAYNSVNPDILLKLKPDDFVKAEKTLEDYYDSHLEKTDKDYYLFGFSDEELMEIVAKPDEWGDFDHQLAKKLLKERGRDVQQDELDALQHKRIEELSTPDKASNTLIVCGYIFAVAGVLIGFILGLTLLKTSRTLPDGRRVPMYTEEDRRHGKRILILSTVVAVLAVAYKLITVSA